MCAIDACDERFEVYRLNTVKARKSYNCDECGRVIERGEEYLYAFGALHGRGEVYHTCGHCKIAADWLTKNCGGFLHHGVWEDVVEHIEEYPHLAFGLMRYKIGIQRKWRAFKSDALLRLPPLAKAIEV